MKRLVGILLATLLLGLVPAAQAEAKTFKNCTDLRKTYKYGVSLNKSAVNRGSGPIFAPAANAAVFRLNKKMDLDRDNIACEVVRQKPKPAAVSPTPTAPSPTPTPTTTATRTPVPTPTQVDPFAEFKMGIQGLNRVGEPLTAHYFIPQGYRLIGIQWLANRQEIVGATTRSFLAPQSLDGQRVSFDLIVSDPTGKTIFPRSMELAPGQVGTATSDLPTVSPPAKPIQSQQDLSQDPSITRGSALTSIEVCKTSDVSPRPGASNGFPRPSNALTGSVSARILYVPIVFSDLPFTDSDLGRIKLATDKVTQFYRTTSYGKVNISYEFLPQQHWVMMKKSAAEYRLPANTPQRSLLEVVEDAFALANPSVNFGLYDGIVLSTGFSPNIYAGVAYTGMTFKTNNGVARAVSFEVGSSTGNYGTMAHELGHSLFGLEDLYVFLNPNRPTVPDPVPAGPWDIMSSNAMEFFGWNKLLMGWLEPSQVRCITNQSSSSHFIETIDSLGNNPKVVLINLSNGVTLAVEGRALPSRGVLVYKIDTRIQHGDGPILAEKVLLAPGANLTRDGWTIKVVGFDTKGFLLDVTRG